MNFLLQKSPHIHRKDSLMRMFLDVLIALFPTLVLAIVSYGFLAVRNWAVSVATMVLAEFVFVLIKNRIPYDGTKHTFAEQFKAGASKFTVNNALAAIISGEIFALIMPPTANPDGLMYAILIVGAAVGMILGKLVFGGTGSNIFNPAAVGMVFAKVCFGSRFVYPTTWYMSASTQVVTGGTVLTSLGNSDVAGVSHFIGQFAHIGEYGLLDMFLGRMPGVLGEAFSITILIGLVYLLIRRTIDWRVIVSFGGTFLGLMALAGLIVCLNGSVQVDFFTFMAFQALSGGLLFGMTFMLTDPVTMPINSPGRVLYGMAAALIVVLVRLFGGLPEGVVYAILISNMLAPVMDYPKWSSSRFTLKKWIWVASIAAFGLLIVGLAMGFGGNVA